MNINKSEDKIMLLAKIRELNEERERQKLKCLSESSPRSLKHKKNYIINLTNRQLVILNHKSDKNFKVELLK